MNNKRRNQANEFDPDFGTNGRLQIDAPGAGATQLTDIKMDIIGDLYLYGRCLDADLSRSSSRATVTRLTREGQIDMSFGTNGFVVERDWELSQITGLVFLNSGGLFITGSIYPTPGPGYIFLASYTHQGVGTILTRIHDGMTVTPGLLATANNTLIINDRIQITDLLIRGALRSRNPDGSEDETFGEQGTVYLFPENNAIIDHMAHSIDSQTFYAAGSVTHKAFIARLNMQGELDTTFARNGTLTWGDTSGSAPRIFKIVPLPGNKIFKLFMQFDPPNVLLVKLDSAGSKDSEFNDGNPLPINDPQVMNTVDMTLAADGKILILSHDPDKCYVTRYLPDGALDTAFGENGSVSFFKEDYFSSPRKIIVQPDRKIVIMGAVTNANNTVLSAALVRLMP